MRLFAARSCFWLPVAVVSALSFVGVAGLVRIPVVKAQAPISVSVNEVIVPVTVTDDKGRFISNLGKNDFKIFDENKEQKIDFFSHEQSQPIVIGFLVDTSNGMQIHWDKYREAATELMLNLLPGDKRYSGYLIAYGMRTGGRRERHD